MVINSQDQITEAVAYQAYGAMVPLDSIANAPEIPAREKFTGKEFDQEGEDSANGVAGIQAYHFGARVYDPEVGVWLAVDAAGQYLNPYGYSTNPVIMVDPDGNYFIGAIIGGAIGFAAGGLIGGAISGEDWSWSGALQGMMMGASLGSGIENAIGVKSFGLGTSAPPSRFPNTAYGRGLMVASSKSIGTFGTLADAAGMLVDTYQFGITASGGGGVGGQASYGVAFGYDEKYGLTFGTYSSAGGGAEGGAGGAVTFDFTYSKNAAITDLAGPASNNGIGFFAGPGGGYQANIPLAGGKTSHSFSIGFGGGPFPVGVRSHVTGTVINDFANPIKTFMNNFNNPKFWMGLFQF